MRTALLLVACLAACFAVCFADEARHPPTLPSTFYAQVSVSMQKEGKLYRGGGIYAVDEPTGRSRLDVTMKGDDEETIVMHQLHVKNITYTIGEKDCTRGKGVKYNNLFAFLPKATLVRSTGMNLDIWQYVDPSTGNKMEISVKGNEVTHFTSGAFNGSAPTFEMTIFSWTEAKNDKWLYYIPRTCTHFTGVPVGDVNGAVYFANNNWNCLDVACSTRVAPGTGQPNYGCAEFVARCLVYGQFIPGIGATDPQSEYYSYNYNGNTYDLCLCSSLSNAFSALGFTSLPATASSVGAACATFGDGGDGYFSHAVIGIGGQNVDAHNNARQNIPVTDDLFNAINAVWGPPGTPPTTGSTSSGYTSYTGGVLETSAEAENVDFVVYDVQKNRGGKKDVAADDDLRLVEINSKSKF